MSTAVTLTADLCRGVRDKTPALMLADWLMEHEGKSRAEALRHVAGLRRASKNARELSEAADLVDPSSRLRRRLEYDCLLSAGEYQDWWPVLFNVVAGSRPPAAEITAAGNDEYQLPVWRVTVGARWLIRYAATCLRGSPRRLPHRINPTRTPQLPDRLRGGPDHV